MTKRDRLLLYGTVYLLSLSVLAFEVSLSRVLAATTGYHMAFLAVSLTIFGLGCGGFVLFSLRRSRRPVFHGDAPALLAAALIPFSLAFFVVLLVHTPLTESWTAFLLVTLLPFFFAGVVLSHLFRRFAERASPLYAFDLIGAAMGCLAVLLLLNLLQGGLRTILTVALIAAVPAALLSYLVGAPRFWRGLAAAGGLLALSGLIAAYSTRFLNLDPNRFQGVKEYVTRMEAAGTEPTWQPELSFWDEFSRVDVIHYRKARPPYKHIFINGRTPANMIGFRGDPADLGFLWRRAGSVAFAVGPSDTVLSIGAGGGLDIFVSLLGGAEKIDAVEINPGVVRATLLDRSFNGGVFQFDRVSLFVEDGRSFLARNAGKRYDVIYLALVQSITGDFNDLAFIEDYLYTTEAVRSYHRHLNPGGRVVMQTHLDRLQYRYLTTLAKMLIEDGTPPTRVLDHIAAFAIPTDDLHFGYVSLLFKDPVPETAARKLARHVRSLNGRVIALPHVKTDPLLDRFVQGEGVLVLDGIDLSPCTDDKPFFFRYSPTFMNIIFSIWGGVLLANAGFVGLLWRRRRRIPIDGGPSGLGVLVAYFMIIGVNYTLVQIVVMQKSILFLGYPTLSLSVVLFTMLLGSGLGSFASRRFTSGLLVRSKGVLALISLVGLAYAFGMGPVYHLLMPVSVGLKLLTVAGLLLPLSFLMGMPMPLGLRAAGRRFSEGIPYFWGLNGTASVLGSVTATAIALSRGFQAAWLVAVMLTMILVWVLHRRAESV